MVERNFNKIRTDRIGESGMEVLVRLVVTQNFLIRSGAYCVAHPKLIGSSDIREDIPRDRWRASFESVVQSVMLSVLEQGH